MQRTLSRLLQGLGCTTPQQSSCWAVAAAATQCSQGVVQQQPQCSSNGVAGRAFPQQQQQQQPSWRQLPAALHAGSWGGAGSLQQRCGYATAPPSTSPSSGGGGGRQRRPLQQQRDGRAQRSGGGGSRQQYSRDRQQQQPPPLGRHAALCLPTERLREPAFPQLRDPFKDRSREAMDPRQVDGSYGDDIEDVLLLRQQLENSALPNEFKRSRFISPVWEDVLLQVNRTVKVTKGGKVETLHALVAVGNGDGLIGIGQHSGKNIQKVTLDAQLKAYRNIVAIPRYRKHTIFHPVDHTQRKVRLRAWPRYAGFGLTASPLMTTLCRLVGLSDVTIKVTGRRKNVRNAVSTFLEGMASQTAPHDGVEGSGVYVREVYPPGPLPAGLKRGVHVP